MAETAFRSAASTDLDRVEALVLEVDPRRGEEPWDELRLLRATLGALDASLVILDPYGTIIALNTAWRRLVAANGWSDPEAGLGTSYLELPAEVMGWQPGEARVVAEGLRGLLAGKRHAFRLEYRSRGPTGRRWFELAARRLPDGSAGRVVISHQALTPRMLSEKALRNRERQQAAVTQLGQFALAGIDISEMMQEAVDSVSTILDLELASYLELGSSGEELVLRAGSGWPAEALGRATVSAGVNTQAGYVLRERLPVVVEELAQETRFAASPLLLDQGATSGLSLVVEGRDRPFGILDAYCRERRLFTRDKIQFFEAVAHTLAQAIEHVRSEDELAALNRTLEERVQERSGFVRLLHEVAVIANQADAVPWALQAAVERLCRHLEWPVGHAFVPCAEDETTFCGGIAALNSPEHFAELIAATRKYRCAAGEGWVGRVVTSGAPQWISELADDHHDQDPRLGMAADLGLRSVLAFPVPAGDEVVAVLEFFASRVVRPDEHLLDVMAQVGAQLGRVVERKRAAEDLRRAKEVAEAAALAKAEFLANMSHEIRTPMNAVIGMTELLLRSRLTAQQKDFCATVHSSANALLALIDDILDFSKIDSGVIEVEQEPFDLRRCVEEALDIIAPDAADKGLNLAYTIADGVPVTPIGDVTRLRQILVNLLGNAVKFTPAGEVLLAVDARPDGAREQIHFAVRDTGIGIPEARMKRLFQPFSQVDASTTREYGGTGLGLAISSRLCALLGGTIRVESEVGKGSTFHVTIAAATAAGREPDFLRPAQPELDGKHLLVAAAHPTNRRLIAAQAGHWGMRVRTTGQSSEALAWLTARDRFEVAILDTALEEVEQVALRARIDGGPDDGTLPVVMLTSLKGLQDSRGTRDHSVRFLTVPIKTERLYTVLIEALAESAAEPPETGPAASAAGPETAAHPLEILLVEDNPVNQMVAHKMLEDLGYEAALASNGREALKALEERTFDVVLLDVQMPELDGFEVARRIRRQWPEDRQPIIIAMTASAMKGDREKCLAAGMDHYLSKPVTIESLRTALEKFAPEPFHRPGR